MSYTRVGPFANDAAPDLDALNMNTIEQGIIDAHTLLDSGASSLAYELDATAATERTIAGKLDEWKSLVDFGADPTGVSDSTAAIAAWLEAGGNLFAPDGTYLITEDGANSGGVEAEISVSTKVVCSGNVKFKAETDLDNDMIRVTAADSGWTATRILNFEWIGGVFDQTTQKNSTVVPFSSIFVPPNVGSSATTDALSIRGKVDSGGGVLEHGFTRVTVKDVIFYASTTFHWESAGGDGGVFIDGALHKHVSNCIGIGCRDLAIYCSGLDDATYTTPEGSTTIRDNRFYGCFFGCACKRTSNHSVIANNIGYNTGCVVLDTDANGEPGENVLITGNKGYQAWCVVRATGTSAAVIEGNTSFDHGHLDELGAEYGDVFDVDPACVRIEGCSKAIVRNNSVHTRKSGTTYTISCVHVTDDDGTDSSSCYVYNNLADGVNYCISEGSGEASNNYYWGNRRFNMLSSADVFESSSLNFDGPLHEDNTQAAHTGTGAYTTMSTATVPAGMLTRENRLHLQASGSTTGTAGTKTIGIKVGTESVQGAVLTAAYVGDWILDGYIDFTTTTTGIRLSFSVVGTGDSGAAQHSFNEDFDAGDIDIELQFALGDTADTITFETFSVRVE